MKTTIKIIGGLLLILSSNLNAQNAQEIVKKAIHASYYQGENFKTKVNMTIIDKLGRRRNRNITMLRRDDSEKDDTQKYYVYFTKPADVRKMVFLAWKNIDRGDDRWLYLPAMDLVKRIAASDERTSFAGSHFFYEDVSGRNFDEDTHELVEQDEKYYVIKSIPKKPNKVEFSYMKNWVDKETFIPMKAEFFGANGTVYRTYSVLDTAVVDGFTTVIDSQMEDNLTGSKTVLNYHTIKYNTDLPENIFTERFLRRPPLKLLLQL